MLASSRVFRCVPVLVLGLLGTVTAQAQDAAGRLPISDLEKLEKRYNNSLVTFRSISSGSQPFNAALHNDVIDVVAKYYVYRMTWSELYPAMHQKVVKDIYDALEAASPKKEDTKESREKERAKAAFLQVFNKRLEVYLKEVLKNRDDMPRVNAAMVLARLSEFGDEKLLDTYVEILKDPKQNDAVKYWALRGIRKLLEPEDGVKDKKLKGSALLAVLEMLGRGINTEGLTAEEVEGQRVVRREAVRALAQARDPGVYDNQKALKGRVAQELLRVVRNDGLKPGAGLDEQVEAAAGIGKLQHRSFRELPHNYQPDYAAQHVGQLIVELADRYQNRSDRDKERPWRIYAAMLTEALDAMKADSEKFAQGKYVAEMVNRAMPILKNMETGGAANAAPLGNWLTSNEPVNKTVYKDLPDSVIKPAPRSEK